jgi:uncharacterized protein YndB with AHSA1/START domain
MDENLIASASIDIRAPEKKVWNALVDPEAIYEYMFGTNVVSEWHVGSSIIWQGEWKGNAYEDHGVILELRPEGKIQYSHFSPLSGQPDLPENYHIVTIELSADGDQTRVKLTQDHNATEEEREHSEQNWMMMLAALKKYVERNIK